jgi:hypothetical protein
VWTRADNPVRVCRTEVRRGSLHLARPVAPGLESVFGNSSTTVLGGPCGSKMVSGTDGGKLRVRRILLRDKKRSSQMHYCIFAAGFCLLNKTATPPNVAAVITPTKYAPVSFMSLSQK